MKLSNFKVLSQLKEEQKFSEDYLENSGLQYFRGSITEVVGGHSSGKTSLVLSMLGDLTQNGEVGAIVDVSNSFNPETALLNEVLLENILWIKCHGNLENAFLICDYLVQAKGFGAIWLNLNFISLDELRHIPNSYWFRFRTGIRGCPTIFVVTSGNGVTGSVSKISYQIKKHKSVWNNGGIFKLLKEFVINQTSVKGRLFGYSKINRISMVYEDV